MDQQQQTRWWPTRRQLLWAAGIVLALAFVISLYGGYRYGWKWTGLVKDPDFHKKTLWDWLGLLIVPAVLALGGYLFTRSESRRTQDIAREQRALDRELANRRTHEDRKAADERRQDDMLQAYLDQIGRLLLDKDRPLRESKEGDEGRTLVRAQTLTVLPRLNGGRKRNVIQFLYESGLITKDSVIVDLKGADLTRVDLSEAADLSGANLSYADLSEANLRRAYVSGANLSGANLSGADLNEANLNEANLSWAADLSGANLRGTSLRRANLRGANLSEADLSGADLSEADLSEAKATDKQLDQAAYLEDTILPNGQKYEA